MDCIKALGTSMAKLTILLATPGGSLQPQAVDKGAQSQEGELGQKFLESQGQTDGKKFAALWVKTEVGAF